MPFDPDQFISQSPTTNEKPVEEKKDSSFDPDAFIASGTSAVPTTVNDQGPVIPAVGSMGLVPAVPTGFNMEAVKQTLEPLSERGKTLLKGYGAQPSKALIDVAATHMGFPPPYASIEGVKGLHDTYKAAKESLSIGTRLASEFADKADTQKYFDLWNAADKEMPGIGKKISDIYNNQGGGDAVRKWLQTSPEGQAFLNNPKTAAIAEQYLGVVPSKANMASRVLAPVGKAALNVANKIAAPIGMGIEGYQGIEQARQGDYTGATLSGLGVASMLNPIGIIAQPGLYMMQQANKNFRQQTPEQQKQSAMDALSGTAPGQAW